MAYGALAPISFALSLFQTAFEVMSVIAVMTNCGLVALSPPAQKYVSIYGGTSVVLTFVLIEVSTDTILY